MKNLITILLALAFSTSVVFVSATPTIKTTDTDVSKKMKTIKMVKLPLLLQSNQQSSTKSI